MSITEELRKFAEGCVEWPRSALLVIADRIDAEHERLMQEQPFTVDMVPVTDERMAEHGWIRLPVDADGEPIHVGDWMTPKGMDKGFEVRQMHFDGEWSLDLRGFGISQVCPDVCRHYHAPTVEDVLREFTDAILEWAGKSGTVAETGTWSDVATEYAARLQLREDA